MASDEPGIETAARDAAAALEPPSPETGVSGDDDAAVAAPVITGMEIERKFLVTSPPGDLASLPSERISQGYVSLDPEGAEVRLRRRADKTFMTIKQGRGLARSEEEFELDPARFARLWSGTSGRRVEKVRYKLDLGEGLTAEIDVYSGALTGLVIAEVEFASVEASARFRPLPWMRPEVTDDHRYANARLALDGVPDRKQVGDNALLDGEPVNTGLIHVMLAQIDTAADALQGADAEEFGTAVHTSRKAFKRARALVRVARDGIPQDVAKRTNAAFRDAGALLSGARDAHVVVEAVDDLARRWPDELTEAIVGPFRAALVHEAGGVAEDREAVDRVLDILATVREDVQGWDLGDEPASVLASGFHRIERDGRKAVRAIHASSDGVDTEGLHELRKRAKDLWYAADLLEVASPKRMNVLAQRARGLTAFIGEDHDLAVLADQVAAHPGAFTEPSDAAIIRDVIARRRSKLHRKALKEADAIYDHPSDVLTQRIRELDER